MLLINNLIAHSSKLRPEVERAVSRVLDRGWFVLGPEVKNFEEQFAKYIGVERSVSVANGTDAIELSLRAVGVTKDDLVATVANAGMYTTTALIAIGAKPFFLDVNVDTRVTTLEECNRAINAGVKAIVVTHLYGKALPEIQEIASVCKQQGIPLIEDCAQSHGAKINGKIVGSFGDIASFSFYPTKNLGALGDGGAIATNNINLADTVSRLRQYGWTSKYEVALSGASNSRLDEMQAAILLEFLPLLDSWNERRRQIASLYLQLINNASIELPNISGEEHVAHLYVIRTKNPESLREHLKINNIASEVHYPIPDYKQPVFGDIFKSVSLKNTELLSKSILTLPCYPEMSDDDVRIVAEAVNSWKN